MGIGWATLTSVNIASLMRTSLHLFTEHPQQRPSLSLSPSRTHMCTHTHSFLRHNLICRAQYTEKVSLVQKLRISKWCHQSRVFTKLGAFLRVGPFATAQVRSPEANPPHVGPCCWLWTCTFSPLHLLRTRYKVWRLVSRVLVICYLV